MDTLITKTNNDQTRWQFAIPCIHSYEKQKKIRVISSKLQSHKQKGNYNKLKLDKNVVLRRHTRNLSSKQLDFASIRIAAALTNESDNIPAYFPGKVIPGVGGASCKEINRGTLFFEQWLKLFEFDSGYPSLEKQDSHIELKYFASHPSLAIRDKAWSWLFVEKPICRLVYFSAMDGEITSSPKDKAKDEILDILSNSFMALIKESQDITNILSKINSLWTDTKCTIYSDSALKTVKELFDINYSKVSNKNVLPFLFELEAFASYMTYSKNLNIAAQGLFAGNWLEIGTMPVSEIKATEFCVTERLLDEILNLVQQRFAPIVVNEFNSVSDGNHRLTSVWLWNLLKFVSNCNWSLDNKEFQKKVANFCNSHEMSNLTKFEVLHHLAVFLTNPKYRSILVNQIKTAIVKHGFIDIVPVTFLPEYLSTTVVKDLYDSGKSIRRVPPSVYGIMASKKDVALPPRASYHFTDAALLPWFSVLPSAVCHSSQLEEKDIV